MHKGGQTEDRRARSTSDPRDGKPPGSSRPPAGQRVLRSLAFGLLLVGVAIGAFLLWRHVQTPSVVLPTRLHDFSPDLVSLIERHAAAVKNQPRNPVRHATLGLVYEANSLWSEAEAAYKNAYRLDPKDPLWPYHAAITRRRAGDIGGAIGYLKRYAARFPRFAPLHKLLGDMLLDMGDFSSAEAAYRQALVSAPNAPEPHTGLGELLLSQGQYQAAVEELKKANRESLKTAERLGHHLTPFTPYGDKEYAYCENPSCKAKLIIEGARSEGYALSYVCLFQESDTRNGV